jgi:hypothetical protein
MIQMACKIQDNILVATRSILIIKFVVMENLLKIVKIKWRAVFLIWITNSKIGLS